MSFEELKVAMGDLDGDKVEAILADLKAQGGTGAAEALAACQGGMDIIGAKYETGEYFVADLIYAGELMTDAADIIKSFLAAGEATSIGKIVIATVQGDIHDVGKNIVKALLEADGAEVIDLGVDVSPDDVVAAVAESEAQVVALSGVLTLAINPMKETVRALTEAGLRDSVKVIIGGAPVTADYCELVGADAWTINAADGVGICHAWLVA